MTEKFICNAAWNALTIWPKGHITPCCLYEYKKAVPLTHYRGVDTFRDLQQEMLSGKRPEGCKWCWQSEDRGLVSYRTHYGDNEEQRQQLKFLDIRNTNACNLACRFCGPEFSSTWTKILTGIEINDFDISNFLTELDLSHLVEIYFAGGEPMMNPAHWKMLTFLIDNGYSKKIKLRYNTNLSLLFYKDYRAEELWPEFKEVEIHGSLEAIGEPLSMIRSGANWETISKNVDKILDLRRIYKKITLSIYCTVGILNYWFLNDFLSWGKEKDIFIELSMLENPDFLTLRALPKSAAELFAEYKVQDDLLTYEGNKKVLELCEQSVGRDEYLVPQTVSHTLMMDHLRKEKLFDIMPWRDHAKKIIFEQQWPKNIQDTP